MHIIERDGDTTRVTTVDRFNWATLPTYVSNQTQLLVKDLWDNRDLLRNLVVRDLKVRYKNSVLGVLWSLLNPLLMMLVFTAVFTVMRGQAIDNFPVLVLVGLMPWQFFSNSVMACVSSIVGSGNLINKVYFPREVLVIAAVTSNLVNFLIEMLILIPILFLFQIDFTGWLFLLPVMIAIQYLFTLGVGFVVATANVFYRDVRMIADVGLLAGFFLTPIFYPMSTLPRSYVLFGIDWDVWQMMYYLNPMASIIANYRVIIFDGAPPALDFLGRTLATSAIFMLLGLTIFHIYKGRFSEEI